MVLCDLYWEYVCALAFRSFGLSIVISKQSIIDMQFLKDFLKHIGRDVSTFALSGHTTHMGTKLSFWMLITFVKTLEIVDICTPNS